MGFLGLSDLQHPHPSCGSSGSREGFGLANVSEPVGNTEGAALAVGRQLCVPSPPKSSFSSSY